MLLSLYALPDLSRDLVPLAYRAQPGEAPFDPWASRVVVWRGSQPSTHTLSLRNPLCVYACALCAWRWRERDLWFQESVLDVCHAHETSPRALARVWRTWFCVPISHARSQQERHATRQVLRALAQNPNTPLEILLECLSSPYTERHAGLGLLDNPALPLLLLESPALVESLARWVFRDPYTHAMSHEQRECWISLRRSLRGFYQDHLRRKFREGEQSDNYYEQANAAWVCSDPECPQDILDDLCTRDLPSWRGARDFASPEINFVTTAYRALANNPALSWRLRRAILCNGPLWWRDDEPRRDDSSIPKPGYGWDSYKQRLHPSRGERQHQSHKAEKKQRQIAAQRESFATQQERAFYSHARPPELRHLPAECLPRALRKALLGY